MSYDESGDLTYNPFAEDNDYVSESNLAQENSSSLLSNSAQNSVKGVTGEGGKNTPEISIVPESPVCLHPLKSALARQNDTVLYDLGITRPHLSRIINESSLVMSEQDDTSVFATPPASNEEIEVIVHEVRSVESSLSFSLLI
jgi:hypothetical protein